MGVVTPAAVVFDAYLVVERGVVTGWRKRPPRGARRLELPGSILLPGLVNAHAHLRCAPLAAAGPFADWIRALLRAAPGDCPQSALALLRSGTTAVGEHDADGSGAAALASLGLRGVAYREFLFADPAMPPAARRGRVEAGLAPHSPYTVSLASARASARAAKRVSIHLAETEEETLWLRSGTGPLEALLRERGRRPAFEVPRLGPVDWLAQAGLLRAGTAVVHANALTRPELRRLAAARCVAVHCPGTHAYFRRGEPPVRRWMDAGLPFALGTDSLASNDELDLFGEMAKLAASDRRLSHRAIFEAATTGGARALSLRRAGTLRPGAPADFVRIEGAPPRSRAALFESLVSRPRVAAVALGAGVPPGRVSNYSPRSS